MSVCMSIPVAIPAPHTLISKTSNISPHQPCMVSGRAAVISTPRCRSYASIQQHNKNPWLHKCSRASRGALRTQTRASQEGIPQEILEDSKFVPINNDDPRFGPPAMLLLGFNEEEVAMAQEMLTDMGGDFMKVLLCTEEMVKGTLNDALNSSQLDLSQVKVYYVFWKAKAAIKEISGHTFAYTDDGHVCISKPVQGVPHICFFSGLTGEELMMLVRAFPEAGLKGTAFAAHVPKNSNKQMEELMEEIMSDHERLSKPQQRAQV